MGHSRQSIDCAREVVDKLLVRHLREVPFDRLYTEFFFKRKRFDVHKRQLKALLHNVVFVIVKDVPSEPITGELVVFNNVIPCVV